MDYNWIPACIQGGSLLGPRRWGGYYIPRLQLDQIFDAQSLAPVPPPAAPSLTLQPPNPQPPNPLPWPVFPFGGGYMHMQHMPSMAQYAPAPPSLPAAHAVPPFVVPPSNTPAAQSEPPQQAKGPVAPEALPNPPPNAKQREEPAAGPSNHFDIDDPEPQPPPEDDKQLYVKGRYRWTGSNLTPAF